MLVTVSTEGCFNIRTYYEVYYNAPGVNLSRKEVSCRRDYTMHHVVEYFANSVKVIQNGTIRKLGYGFSALEVSQRCAI